MPYFVEFVETKRILLKDMRHLGDYTLAMIKKNYMLRAISFL